MSFQQLDQPRKRRERRPNHSKAHQLFNEESRDDSPPRDTQQYIRVKRRVETIVERYRDLVSRQFQVAERLRDSNDGDRMELAMRETMKNANEQRLQVIKTLHFLLKFQGAGGINYGERERRLIDYNKLEKKVHNIDRTWAKAVAESKEAEKRYAEKCLYQQDLIRKSRVDLDSNESQQTQLLLAEEIEDDQSQLLKDRFIQIEKIYDEVSQVEDLMVTLNEHINAPQAEIDSITDNVNAAEEKIDLGVQHVITAEELQDGCTNSMACITLSMALATMVMVTLMVFWLKSHGLL